MVILGERGSFARLSHDDAGIAWGLVHFSAKDVFFEPTLGRSMDLSPSCEQSREDAGGQRLPIRAVPHSCQYSTSGSPSFQERQTLRPSSIEGKVTMPSGPLAGSTPSARNSSTYSRSRRLSFSNSDSICTNS